MPQRCIPGGEQKMELSELGLMILLVPNDPEMMALRKPVYFGTKLRLTMTSNRLLGVRGIQATFSLGKILPTLATSEPAYHHTTPNSLCLAPSVTIPRFPFSQGSEIGRHSVLHRMIPCESGQHITFPRGHQQELSLPTARTSMTISNISV